MLPSQKYSSTRYGVKAANTELRSISNRQSHNIADRMAVLWLVVVLLGIMILSFGRLNRELTIIGALMINLSFGIIIGYGISQTVNFPSS